MEDRCKEKILSEDYWDFIISPYREDELEGVDTEKMCIQELDFGYKSVSLDSRMLLPYPCGSTGTVRSPSAIHFWICSR